MAKKYDWGDGKGAVHSISFAQHQQNVANQAGAHGGPAVQPYSALTVSQGAGQPAAPIGQYVAQQQQTAAGPPVDPALLAQQNAAQQSIALGNAWDTYNRGQIENEYGLGPDVSNPFSRAKLLADSYKQNQLGTTNSYASSGQLYSGALNNARNTNARNYAISYDQLKRQYQNAKDQITQGAAQRYSQVGSNLTAQQIQALIAQIGK